MKITTDVKKCILRLSAAFKREAKRRAPEFSYDKIAYRLASALGLSRSTIYGILNECKSDAVQNVVSEVHIETKEKRKKMTYSKRQKMDTFNQDLLNRIVHQMYANKEFVTLKKLKEKFATESINVSLPTVRKYLIKMGYHHKKKDGKRFLKETNEIVAARHDYLRKIKKFRQDGWEVVYLDETWINSNHACAGTWTHNTQTVTTQLMPECRHCGRHIPSGKGRRLIVLDAGSSTTGFIPGVGLIFESKTKSSDYHDEMNGSHFMEWFENTLLRALPNPSVIVFDNAPYHNIRTEESLYPTSNSKKEDIVEWLRGRNVHLEGNELKVIMQNIF